MEIDMKRIENGLSPTKQKYILKRHGSDLFSCYSSQLSSFKPPYVDMFEIKSRSTSRSAFNTVVGII